MTPSPSQDLQARLADEIASVVGTLLEKTATARPAAELPEPGYLVAVEPRQGGRGSLQILFDRSGAQVLARRVDGLAVEPSEAVVINSVREICTQAIASLLDKHPVAGARLDVASVRASSEALSGAASTLVVGIDGEDPVLRFALAGTLVLDADAPASVGRPAGSHPSLEVILDIDLPLVVRFGRTELPLKTLAALGPGSVIDLGRSPDDLVDVLVSHQIVAKGEVVIVAGHYGVRIRDIVAPADRVRSMEVQG
jgi:flagellar motor switch protein FliN